MTDQKSETINGQAWAAITGIGHVRLTVTDIVRSKQFYAQLLGTSPAFDFSDQADEPGVREDPARFYGGCAFAVGEQLLGLRPVAASGERFDSTRVGLDHISLSVGLVADLHQAEKRLDAAQVPHGQITDLEDAGMVILSLQDPDDINVELTAQAG